MSINTSSSSNDSLIPPHLTSTNSSLDPDTPICFQFRSAFFIFTSFSVTNIFFLLPLYILIIFLGLRRWWKQRSTAATSHSDIFTYHMVAMEMIGVFGCGCFCCGVLVNVSLLTLLGLCFFHVVSNGQIFVHMLTCVERHLAVVHPIAYQRLRNRGEVRIRNVTISCVWLLFLGTFGLTGLASNFSSFSTLFFLVLAIVVVSFCSFSVLRVLTRPGPGERGGQQVDQLKLRAFHTIMAIMVALLLRFGGHLFVVVIYFLTSLNESFRCGVLVSGVWFCLPSSLVLPLLFLYRAGKLSCCKKNSDLRQG